MKVLGSLCILALAMAIATTPASAQVLNSNAGTVTLNATLPESITLTVQTGASVNFTLAANTASNAGSTTTTVKTAWVLKTSRTAVGVWAFVNSGAAALSDGTNNIPASAVSAAATGSVSAGGALNTSTSGGAGVPAFIGAGGTGVQIGNIALTAANRASSTTTTITWNIDTTVTPQLPASAYTGTVNIQAQATP